MRGRWYSGYRRSMTIQRVLAIPVLLAACCALTACGDDLSDGDTQVCAAAHEDDARAVYGVAALADDEEIARQASRIQMGTSDESDDDALAQIRSRCTDLGYGG